MKRRVLAIASLLALAGCGGEKLAIEEAKKAVRVGLSDPASAEFADVYVVPYGKDDDGGESYVVCGKFNAKNQFGGYAGYVRFRSMQHHPNSGKPEVISTAIETEPANAPLGTKNNRQVFTKNRQERVSGSKFPSEERTCQQPKPQYS